MKILIIGASGFLGNKLFTELSKNNDVLGTSRSGSKPFIKLNILSPQDVERVFATFQPNIVVFTAGVARPSDVSSDIYSSYQVNVLSLIKISQLCKEYNTKIIYPSSIYVFNGKKQFYLENTERSAYNKYGELKIKSENIVKKVPHLILRSDIVYGFDKNHYNNGFIGNLINSNQIKLNSYASRKPIYVDDYTAIVQKVITKNLNETIHLTGNDSITLFNLGKKICQALKINCKILPEKTENQVPILQSNKNIYSFTALSETLNQIKKNNDFPNNFTQSTV